MDVEGVESFSLDAVERFSSANENSEKKRVLVECISQAERDSSWITVPTSSKLFAGSKWVNCNRSLAHSDISGKLVLLDFFTYCCINCIHIMPFLHHLESKYPTATGLVVIGVHSAKFPNEKLEDNIRNAISRNNLQHPVVNDLDIQIWDEFSIKCWPTLVLISPSGKVLFSIAGESHMNFVEGFIDVAMEFYQSKHQLIKGTIPIEICQSISPTEDNLSGDIKLKYPGKVAIDELGERVAISDGGNNRVIVCGVAGDVLFVIGGLDAGFANGNFDEARFDSPQGLTWHGQNAIFVADCNNHAVRKIDLMVKRVVTVCGTGVQGSDLEGGKPGLDQPISSPWDLLVGGSLRFPDGRSILYIAMSGCHQIWAFFLKTTDYQKGVELEMGTCIRYAGSGNEENRNNSYPHKAGFAQPSGLALDEKGHSLYVADSESSTIRKINLGNGAVQALVGGDIDPTNLFSFGDGDGKGRDAKLQHPIGVAWDSKRNVLYVADTYNHKIKSVDPKTKICRTCEFCRKDGGLIFNEPSGLALDPTCEHLYVADTNNHEIKIVSLDENSIRTMNLKSMNAMDALSLEEDVVDGPSIKIAKAITSNKTQVKSLDQIKIHKDQDIHIILTHPNFILSSDAPSSWQVSYCLDEATSDACSYFYIASGKYDTNGSKVTIPVTPLTIRMDIADKINVFDLCIESVLYYCVKDSGVCMMHNYKALLPVRVIFQPTSDHLPLKYEIEIQ